MSARTPSRISLRRKRLCNDFDSIEPSSKRISPAKNDHLILEQERDEDKEIIKTNNSSIAATFMTPKSYGKKVRKRNVQTPKTHRDVEEETLSDSKNEETELEFSPSQSPSQFPSSQMPSTQDWEVVWDCNSPGYSKEELKKMGGRQSSEKPSSSSPIVPIPNRHLFSKLKRPPLPLSPIHLPTRQNSKTSMAVAAELDSLLTKVNGERIQQLQEQSDDDEPLVNDISNILNASSQPFNVSNLEEENLNSSVHNSKEIEIEKDSVPYDKFAVPLVKNVVKPDNPEKNVNFLSFDDDDLFSESFLLSSQALEESVLQKELQSHKPNLIANNRFSPLSRIRKKTPTVIEDNRDLELEKVNSESITFSAKPKSLYNCKIIPDFLSPISSKTIEVDSSVANSISDNLCLDEGKLNTQNNFDSSDLLNTKTSDINQTINSFSFKTNKPRATFQLTMPSNQSLHKLFTSRLHSSENSRTICNLKEKDTCENSSFSTEKFNRSKSESSQLSANGTKITSSNSSVEFNFHANASQEDDDDDELFASLIMPGDKEVGTETGKKLSEDSKINSKATNTLRANMNSFPVLPMSKKNGSSFHDGRKYSLFKSSNAQTNSIACTSRVQSYNKSSQAKRFPADNTSSLSEKKSSISEGKTESCIGNQRKSFTLDMKDRGKNCELKDESEDEGDDFLLEEGVLDYLGQFESQYISSQSSPQKSDANSPTAVKVPSSSHVDSADYLCVPNKSENLLKNRLTVENESSKNMGKNHPSGKNNYTRSIDSGSKMLLNEFFKVGKTADKLKKVLNCDLTNNIKEKVDLKRISPRRSSAVKNAQNSKNFLTDEDMLTIAFGTSTEKLPSESSEN